MGNRLGQLYGRFEERVGALRQFRVHTFLVLLIVGISIIYYLNFYIEADVLQRLARSTSFVSQNLVAPHLNIDDLDWPQKIRTKKHLDTIIRENLLNKNEKTKILPESDSIEAVKVWNLDYRIVYDSNRKLNSAGERHTDNDELKEAYYGSTNADYVENDSEDKFIFSDNPNKVEIYVPLILKGQTKPSGAMEIYLSTSAISNFSRNTMGATAVIVLLGLIFLYFSLSWFFSRVHNKIAEKNNELHVITDKFISSLKELEENYLGTIQALTMAVDAKDHYTAGHSFRVAAFSKEIGKILGLSDDALKDLERGARFHDIGKIGIKETILNKEASLTTQEYNEMKRHTVIGAKILGKIKFLQDVVPIVRWHHERLDGSGYPDGLAEINIPLAAKIVAVADVFDSMTSDRPYRKSYDTDTAFKELRNGAGSLYDKEVVHALIETYIGTSGTLDKNSGDSDSFSLIESDLQSDPNIDSISEAEIMRTWNDSSSTSSYKNQKNKSKRKSVRKRTA